MVAAPALLRTSVTFRRFWTGQVASLVGDQITIIAMPLLAVLVLDAGAAQMGYLAPARSPASCSCCRRRCRLRDLPEPAE